MATQVMQAMGPSEGNMYPLPSLPSPTLTNPDMVLPHERPSFSVLPSPPRNAWRDRPPSPSYLRDHAHDMRHDRSGSNSSSAMAAKKEKLGLMSRKMMLLRSRTASNSSGTTATSNRTPVQRTGSESDGYGSVYGSSPTLMDVGNLAPEQPQYKRQSKGDSSHGSESDELVTLKQFLSHYEKGYTSSSTDEESLTGSSPAPQQYTYAASIDSSAAPLQQDDTISIDSRLVAQRKQQEEDEQNSAILSKRAEEILANAKKRLNLMEGNLRGARDLVTPLTAANLKRATSVGLPYHSQPANFGGRNRYVVDGYPYDSTPQPAYRTLQTQASSPTMGRDYQGHWRGFSETELPERPYTSLETPGDPNIAYGGQDAQANDPSWTHTLKGSRSHDSLGQSGRRSAPPRDPHNKYSKASPDASLGALVEEDGQHYYQAPERSTSSQSRSHDGSNRSASRTEDLREQMTSLKGKISTLRERAREDSLRRQSVLNLREPSPLNNAAGTAPELFYASSPSYGGPVLDTNAGVGQVSQEANPVTPVATGSRNAFAEQAERTRRQTGTRGAASERRSSQSLRQSGAFEQSPRPRAEHKRTPSGTAIVESSNQRYVHRHARDGSRESLAQRPIPDEIGVAHGGTSVFDDNASEAGASVYEDAPMEQLPVVVAHEDREDAFDYHNFFLHSAIGIYGDGARRGSTYSDESVSSTETARGPTAPRADIAQHVDDFDADSENYPPGTPETPEKLRAIERKLHQRTQSNESMSTIATFATATEGRETPPSAGSNPSSATDWPMPRSENFSRPNSRRTSRLITAISRPNTAIPVNRSMAYSDSSSDRADSGVGIPQRSHSSHEAKRPPPPFPTRKPSLSSHSKTTYTTLSPPMSPQLAQDPATVVVNALLGPSGHQLGLKDKAMLFGLVESLRRVCNRLQEEDEASYESRMLRKRLDDARNALGGPGIR